MILATVLGTNFKSLQRVQNTLARVVLRRGKFEHITPALIDLHLDILQLPPGTLYHLISAIVTLSLLLNVD